MVSAKTSLRQHFEAAFGALKSTTPVAAASWTMVAVLLVSVPSMCEAAQKLLARAGSVTKVNALGVELTISEDDVKKTVLQFNPQLDHKVTKDVVDAIAKLEPEEYVRLMQVGELQNLCEFQYSTAKMRRDVALDYALKEKNIVDIEDDSDTFKRVIKEKHPDIGNPLYCYKMTLTSSTGHDVKTVLVQSFKDAFDPPHGHAEPAPGGAEVAAR
jgi:hypothetical protein